MHFSGSIPIRNLPSLAAARSAPGLAGSAVAAEAPRAGQVVWMREEEAAWGAQIFGCRWTRQIVVRVLALPMAARLLALAAERGRGLPSSRRMANFLRARRASQGASAAALLASRAVLASLSILASLAERALRVPPHAGPQHGGRHGRLLRSRPLFRPQLRYGVCRLVSPQLVFPRRRD